MTIQQLRDTPETLPLFFTEGAKTMVVYLRKPKPGKFQRDGSGRVWVYTEPKGATTWQRFRAWPRQLSLGK